MKILINTMSLSKGGAERVISLLANYLSVSNEVMIITHVKTKVEYNFDNKIIIKSIGKGNNLISKFLRRISILMLYRLKKEVLNYNPDVVISFLPEAIFRMLALKKHCKKIKNIPMIISIRNDPETEYKNLVYHFIMKKLYPYADQMILQTIKAKEYFKKHINYEGTVIFNPVSDEFLTKRYSGVRQRKVVAVGRLEPQKNYKNMIDAFEIVHKKHNDYVLEIYGDGSQKNILKEYINTKNLQDYIFLMGKSDNIKEKIYDASLFVMSSNYEGMPNALLEATCLGIPCVSTDCPCGGPDEILDHGKNGILVPIKNPEELSKGICKLIEEPKLAEKYSINSCKNAKKFNKDLILKQWYNEIDKIIK